MRFLQSITSFSAVLPIITSVYPDNGVAAGGTSITITGSNFLDGATVEIGGVACTSITVDSSTQISCTTDANSAGLYDVVVINPGQICGIAIDSFTYT